MLLATSLLYVFSSVALPRYPLFPSISKPTTIHNEIANLITNKEFGMEDISLWMLGLSSNTRVLKALIITNDST